MSEYMHVPTLVYVVDILLCMHMHVRVHENASVGSFNCISRVSD